MQCDIKCMYVSNNVCMYEVCNGKVFARDFRTDQATKERGLCEKTEGKYFPVQTEQTRLIRLLFYIWLLVHLLCL